MMSDLSKFYNREEQSKFDDKFFRKWALESSIAFFSRVENASSESVLEVAAQFETYLRGVKDEK